MNAVVLLTVEDSFEIPVLGVVLHPDLSVPNGYWKARTDSVTVVTPDGQQFQAMAKFNLSHINIPDPSASIDRRWRVVVSLPGRAKREFPVGTKILVSQEIRDALLPNNTG